MLKNCGRDRLAIRWLCNYVLNSFIEMDTTLSGSRSLGFILDVNHEDGLEGTEWRKWKDLMLDGEKWSEGWKMVVLWEHWEMVTIIGVLLAKGGQYLCHSGIHSVLSNANQPLPPRKLSSVPISWEWKLMVTKSCSDHCSQQEQSSEANEMGKLSHRKGWWLA